MGDFKISVLQSDKGYLQKHYEAFCCFEIINNKCEERSEFENEEDKKKI